MPPFLTDPSDIHNWLNRYCEMSVIGDIKVSEGGLVSVTHSLFFNAHAEEHLTHFAVQFDRVEKAFNAAFCSKLTTLEGAPPYVGEYFDCSTCENLTSLNGVPAYIGGNFDCWNSPIQHLAGLHYVGGYLIGNPLPKPTASQIQAFLLAKKMVRTKQPEVWCDIVNAYHQNGDLLMAVSLLEDYLQVPLSNILTPVTNMDVPTL